MSCSLYVYVLCLLFRAATASAPEVSVATCPVDKDCDDSEDDQALLGLRHSLVARAHNTDRDTEDVFDENRELEDAHQEIRSEMFLQHQARKNALRVNDTIAFNRDAVAAEVDSSKTYYEMHSCPSLSYHKPARDYYSVAVVISGRIRQETLLLSYLNDLVRQGKLDEIHLHLVRGDKLNVIRDIGLANLRTRVVRANSFTELWRYYDEWHAPTPELHKRTVFVKMDDDIVFVNTTYFDDYVKYVVDHPELGLVMANVVNNGVAAYYQGLQGCFPKLSHGVKMTFEYPGVDDKHWGNGGTLWESPEKAREVHRAFLKNSSCFSWLSNNGNPCIRYRPPPRLAGHFRKQGRFSVNFFALQEANRHKIFDTAFYAMKDDETYLTEVKQTKNCMYTLLPVSHASFFTQADITDDMLSWYTLRRMNISNLDVSLDAVPRKDILRAFNLKLPPGFDPLESETDAETTTGPPAV